MVFAEEVNPGLNEAPSSLSGSLAKLCLTSLVKEATGMYRIVMGLSVIVTCGPFY